MDDHLADLDCLQHAFELKSMTVLTSAIQSVELGPDDRSQFGALVRVTLMQRLPTSFYRRNFLTNVSLLLYRVSSTQLLVQLNESVAVFVGNVRDVKHRLL